MKIFSGSANQKLADGICKWLGQPSGQIYLHSFPSGESYVQFQENIRGQDVFLVQPIAYPANDSLMQLLVMADAAKRASANRITAVIPYFGYSRQDRKDKPRVPISSKLVMNLIASAGFNRVLTMDLHAAQIGGFTDLPFDHLSFKPLLVNALKVNSVKIDMVVAPDIGAVKRATEYGKQLKKNLAIVVKQRLNDTDVVVENFIGDVRGKNVLIVDDLTESVGTLTEAAKACRKNGAEEVNIAVTHGCFTEKGIENLKSGIEKNLFTRVFYSNTVSTDWYENRLDHSDENVFDYDCVIPVDVSPLFAQAIRNIHTNTSVSELFDEK